MAIFLVSCGKSEIEIDTTIPVCIQNTIDDTILSMDLKTVRVQNVDNELHYWMNTGVTHFDGVEYIVNSKCDTICSFCGECIPSECSENYDNNWKVIWER